MGDEQRAIEAAWGAYVHPDDDEPESAEIDAMRVAIDAYLAAMRSGAPPQPDSVEALAEARGLGMEALRLLARLHGRRSDDRIWDFEEWADTQIGAFIAAHGHRSLVGLCEAFERMMETGEPPASQSTEPGREQVGAPRLDLTREEAAALLDENGPEEGAERIAWLDLAGSTRAKLRAFLAGAPPDAHSALIQEARANLPEGDRKYREGMARLTEEKP